MFQEHALKVASFFNNARAAALLLAVETLEEKELIPDGRKRPRTSRARVNYSQTVWAKSLEEVTMFNNYYIAPVLHTMPLL